MTCAENAVAREYRRRGVTPERRGARRGCRIVDDIFMTRRI